ncbi:hypothetical protein [uncultured Bacteroides sp.]|jgi:hypothetical protein|uniref:hypothetical protein n=1 Tax=uncultured Bacteroides sp. TaxID=162156 RepID=UPI00267653CC|nr:hypothetical protein [uncultured Bacteroides sp.]
MELQNFSKEQLIERIEKLSTNLDRSIANEDDLKAKVFENEKIVGELRVENESLKNEVKVQRESTNMYKEWWQSESNKLARVKESLDAASVVLRAITNEATK